MDKLYHFRDCYFETHNVEEAEKKESDVAQELDKTLKTILEKEGQCCVAANFFCLLLKTANE